MSDPFADLIPQKTDPFADLVPQKQDAYTGMILPWRVDENGQGGFAVPRLLSGAAESAYSAATLPGDVVTGKVDPMSDEGIARAFELGMWATPVTPGVRSGEGALPFAGQNLREMKNPPVPTGQELRSAGGNAYDVARDLGVDFKPEAVATLAVKAQNILNKKGLGRDAAPSTNRIVKNLLKVPKAKNPDESITSSLAGLVEARQSLSAAAQRGGSEGEAARQVLKLIDPFIERPDPRTVISGPASQAGAIIETGRKNYAAGMRSKDITQIGTKAARRARTANSGKNLDNIIRQRVASFLDREKKITGFNDEEIAALNVVAEGTRGRNALRDLGNRLAGGGGVGNTFLAGGGGAIGYAAGGWPGAVAGATIPAATGSALRGAAGKLTQRALNQADELVRQRSPLYQQIMENPPIEAVPRSTMPARAAGGAAVNSGAGSITMDDVQRALRNGEITSEEATQLIRFLQGNET